jgi:chemotaxis regulatin CheY-phosphate phosphatase CheZ
VWSRRRGYDDPIERVTSREARATLEASELSNQISMLARMVRARLLKALEAETLEEAHVKIDDAIDGLDTIIEMTPPAEPQDGQGEGA